MSKKSLSVCVIVAAFLLCGALFAQSPWVALGPDGGDARALTSDPKNPDRVYAGTATGELFVTNNFGKSWERFARIGVGDDYVLDNISVDPQSGAIYVAAWTLMKEGGGLYLTKDGGKTWQSLKEMQGKSIRAMALAPTNPKVIVVGALDGVFRSSDAGNTWERISPANYAELKNVESIAIDPLNPNVIYAGTWHLPWKTEDGGKTWHNIKNGVIDDSDVFSIIVDPKMPSVVYASACSGIYKSENAGELFHKVQGMPYTARRTRVLQQDPARRDIVYAGTTEGLWRTADSGKTWKMLTGKNVIVNDVLIDPRDYNHLLIATDRSGILYSANDGASFEPVNNGYSHRQVATLQVSTTDPNTLYAGVLNDKEYGGVFASHDLGANWEQISNGLEGHDVFVLRQAATGELIAGTNHGIFVKTVAGTWHPANDVVRETIESQRAVRSKNGKRVPAKTIVKTSRSELTARVNDLEITSRGWLAATTAGLYSGTDRGKTWKLVPLSGVSSVRSVATRGNDWLVGAPASVRLSTDAGVTWMEPKLPNVTNVVSVAIAPDGTLWVAASQAAFRSTDHGRTWNYAWNMPVKRIASLEWNDGLQKLVVIPSESTDIYESADGQSWSAVPVGWVLRDVKSIGGRVVAATAFDGVVLQPAGGGTQQASLTTRH